MRASAYEPRAASSLRIRSSISSTASAASKPLFPALPPARASAPSSDEHASAQSRDEQKPSAAEAREAAAPAPLAPAPSAAPLPTLAEAFAALLSAERGSPVTAPAAAPAAANEELIEQVTRRVIERIGADSVRDAVIEVAERLVAEEIARIKAAAR